MSQQVREHWVQHGIPPAVIERMATFENLWGGLILPPSPCYDGGPKFFQTDVPEPAEGGGWWFSAGNSRTAVPYGFIIGPNDEFGIHGDRWAPLHASMEGWVESVALAYRARMWAANIATIHGGAVNDIDLSSMAAIPEVAGLTDTWWRGGDTVIAIYRGEAIALGSATFQRATVYTGIEEPEIYLDC